MPMSKPRRAIRLIGIIFLLLAWCLCALPVAAADSVSILSTKVFGDLLETGDQLVVVHYNLHYDTEPAVPANQYYTFRLLSNTGVTLGTANPYPYFNYGYDQGAFAFYFPAASAPVWGSANVVHITANPAYPAALPVTPVTLDPSVYYSGSDDKVGLGVYILNIAGQLQTNWNISMTTYTGGKNVLTSTGAGYFNNTISNLVYMAPDIFSVKYSTIAASTRTFDHDVGTAWGETFTGTWVEDALRGGGELLTGDEDNWQWFASIFIIVGVIALAIYSHRKFGTIIPAEIPGYILIFMGARMGFMPWQMIGILGIIMALFIAYHVVFKHA